MVMWAIQQLTRLCNKENWRETEPVKSRCPAYDLYKKVKFSSHMRAKVGHQGPPGFATAQPWLKCKHFFLSLTVIKSDTGSIKKRTGKSQQSTFFTELVSCLRIVWWADGRSEKKFGVKPTVEKKNHTFLLQSTLSPPFSLASLFFSSFSLTRL